jgi:hypothetical protein
LRTQPAAAQPRGIARAAAGTAAALSALGRIQRSTAVNHLSHLTSIAFLSLVAAAAQPAHADKGTCTTKTTCTRKPTCEAGFTLVQQGTQRFYCQKVSTSATDRQPLSCDRGTLVTVDGVDYCQWAASRTPACEKRNGNDDWEWHKAEKKCRRVANNGDVKWATENITCDPGLKYKASTGRCEGTLRDTWSLTELVAKCEGQLAGSVYIQDFEGNKDMCALIAKDTAYAAPTLVAP